MGSSRRRSWLEIVSDVAAFLSLNAGYITNKMRKKLHVYAVLRVDEDIAGDEAIMVKEILPTLEEAVQEVGKAQSASPGKALSLPLASWPLFPRRQRKNVRSVFIRLRLSSH